METKTLSLKDIVENNLTNSQVWKPIKTINCSNTFCDRKYLNYWKNDIKASTCYFTIKINMNSKNGFKMNSKNLTIQNELVDTDWIKLDLHWLR